MKFDIENYESMTVEEKLAALEAYEPKDLVSKAALDKAASEAASYKKQLREKMTEEEARKAQDAEALEALKNRVMELENERAVNSYVTSYLALGYDEKLAKSSAKALADGDMVTVFANQKAHVEAQEKALRAEILKSTPRPTPGDGNGTGMTLEKLRALSPAERYEFSVKNPDEYRNLYGGN